MIQKSVRECPFCGGNKWDCYEWSIIDQMAVLFYVLNAGSERIESSTPGATPTIDSDLDCFEDGCAPDECCGCKAVIS